MSPQNHNPNPKPAPPPRTLNVKRFAEARSRELESLHSIISNRLDHDFKIHRSKRRRTTGYRGSKHNVRKPTGSDSGPNPNPNKTSRRVQRRLELRSNPDSGFVRSGDGTKRLRTHIWHAKRFKMVKRWGFYLPLGVQGSGRGSRAVLRWLKSGAVVHDASYCHPIQLEGSEDSILAVLGMVLLPLPSNSSEENSHMVHNGVCCNNAMLYHVGSPFSKFISPVFYMWRPLLIENHNVCAEETPVSSGCGISAEQECHVSSRQLWIWIHPAAFVEGFEALKIACEKQVHKSAAPVSCVSLEGRIAKLEIMGSKATQYLQRVLHLVSEKTSGYDGKFLALQNAGNLPFGAILSLTVSDPRDSLPKNIKGDLKSTRHGDLQEQHIQSCNSSRFNGSAKDKDDMHDLWSKPESNGVFLSDSRLLWDSSEKLIPPLAEDIFCSNRHQKRLKCFNLDKINDENSAPAVSDCFGQYCSLLLVKHANRRKTGWSIVLPLSWVKAFWIPLISVGACAIGLRERRWIASDSGLPCFPYDFPDCKAYLLLMAEEATAFNSSAERRPPAVRPLRVPIPPPWECIESTCKRRLEINTNTNAHVQPYASFHFSGSLLVACSQRASSSSPEQSDVSFNGVVLRHASALSAYLERTLKMASESGMHLVRVLIHAYKEGVFEDGAIVCAPTLSDFPLWESSLEDNNKLQVPQSLVKSYFTQQDSGKWELQLPESCSDPESYRWPIGFVTTGFVRGSKKPMAIAFCEAKLLAQLREQQSRSTTQKEGTPKICVLVRNLRSAAHRRAFATIVLEEDKEDTQFM